MAFISENSTWILKSLHDCMHEYYTIMSPPSSLVQSSLHWPFIVGASSLLQYSTGFGAWMYYSNCFYHSAYRAPHAPAKLPERITSSQTCPLNVRKLTFRATIVPLMRRTQIYISGMIPRLYFYPESIILITTSGFVI